MTMTIQQLEEALIQQQQINRRLRAENTRLRNRLAPATEDETLIFDHWRAVMGKPRTKLTASKRQAIRSARREYSHEECIRAIDGCAALGHVSERGVRYNDLELILRKVDLNLERWEAAKRDVVQLTGKAGEVERNVRALERMAGP